MKREYESVVIFDGSLPDEAILQEQAKIEDYLSKNTEFIKTEVWGKRKLAYEIDRKKSGFYCFFIYKAEGETIDKLSKYYRLNSKIIRTMTVLYEEVPQVKPEVLNPQDAEAAEEEE